MFTNLLRLIFVRDEILQSRKWNVQLYDYFFNRQRVDICLGLVAREMVESRRERKLRSKKPIRALLRNLWT